MNDTSRPKIALIAHDGKKLELIRFAQINCETLKHYTLIATGTTGQRLQEEVGLDIERVLSGPLGGDAQIAAQVVTGLITAVLFIVDPMFAQPHEPDIQSLQRLCNVHNVPLATNLAAAQLILDGLSRH